MALIETGLAGGKDEALAAGAAVPPGTYKAQFMGFLKNPENGGTVFTSQKGGKYYKASFKVVEHPDPLVNGKRLPIYNATPGVFSFSDLVDAIPFTWQGSAFDDESGIGTVIYVKVTLETKGDFAGQPRIAKVSSKPI